MNKSTYLNDFKDKTFLDGFLRLIDKTNTFRNII